MIKYTHKENADMMAPLTSQAFELGLISVDDKLVYEKGGRGTATVIRLVRRDPETQNRHPQMRPQWVPEFGYKDGPSVVGNALVNVSNVLYSIMKQREDAAPVAAQAPDTEEHAVYWDTETDEDQTPYGADTARIVDLEQGGVIAYCHKDNAHRIVMAVRSVEE